jgi:phosphoribosyl-ATP pyrophosphohydrolase/phosphoribosyl-AMP cyclohydrolase
MISKRMIEENLDWGTAGMVPAVIQDAADGRVLMVAYVDPEALAATLTTGMVHFHSRSRDRLWRKGESSGNALRVVDIAPDCDGDALLIQAEPAGPTCHRGTRSCFDQADEAEQNVPLRRQAAPERQAPIERQAPPEAQPEPIVETRITPQDAPRGQGFEWLETLWETIEARAGADPAGSYTARLLAAGVDGPARKVAEEATEVLMAAKDDAVARPEERGAIRDALTSEVADLLYHTLVLLLERGLAPSTVIARLRERHRP